MQQIAKLKEGKKIRLEGSLLFEKVGSAGNPMSEGGNCTLKVVPLVMHLCQSELAVVNPVINLGKFGLYDGWQDKAFECEVINMSEIPLRFTCAVAADDIVIQAAGNPPTTPASSPLSPKTSPRDFRTRTSSSQRELGDWGADGVRVVPPLQRTHVRGCLLGSRFSDMDACKVCGSDCRKEAGRVPLEGKGWRGGWRRLPKRLGAVTVGYNNHGRLHVPSGGQRLGIGWAPWGGGGRGLPPPVPMDPSGSVPRAVPCRRPPDRQVTDGVGNWSAAVDGELTAVGG